MPVHSPLAISGFYETNDESKPAQILCFHEITSVFFWVFVVARLTPCFHSQYTPVSLQFVPLLQAYFVPEDFYREGEVLTMPIPSQVALQVDIHSLSKDHNYSVFIDSTNKARIQ